MPQDEISENTRKGNKDIYDCTGFTEEQSASSQSNTDTHATKCKYEYLKKGSDNKQYTLLTMPNMEAILSEMSGLAEDVPVSIPDDMKGIYPYDEVYSDCLIYIVLISDNFDRPFVIQRNLDLLCFGKFPREYAELLLCLLIDTV